MSLLLLVCTLPMLSAPLPLREGTGEGLLSLSLPDCIASSSTDDRYNSPFPAPPLGECLNPVER